MKNIVLVDIDDTISIVGDRKKYGIETPPNWDEFHSRCDEDKPMMHVIELVNALPCAGYLIYFMTMRPESVRSKTIKWLNKYIPYYDGLFMRYDNDNRCSVEVKIEMLLINKINLNNILLFLEDNDNVINSMIENGVNCLKVISHNGIKKEEV